VPEVKSSCNYQSAMIMLPALWSLSDARVVLCSVAKNLKVLSSKSKCWTAARARLRKSVSTILKYSNDGSPIMGLLRTPLAHLIMVSMRVPSKERVWARH